MTKDSGSKSALAQKEQANGQQKKQAKKEAKAMLAIEQVKASLEKAQGKLAKAQARVAARSVRLSGLEAKLTQLTAEHTSSPGTAVDAPDSGFDHQLGQPEPQDLTKSADVDAPPSNSLNGANQDNATHPESETTSGSSMQETGDISPVAPVKATVAVTATDQESSGPLLSSSPTPATPGVKAPTSRARTTRRAPTKPPTPAKQSSSSTPVRRTTIHKHVNKTTPEASNGNKSE